MESRALECDYGGHPTNDVRTAVVTWEDGSCEGTICEPCSWQAVERGEFVRFTDEGEGW